MWWSVKGGGQEGRGAGGEGWCRTVRVPDAEEGGVDVPGLGQRTLD